MSLDKIVNCVSNLTMYDLKSVFRKAQNLVLNYNETEAKVREATNNEPWGASFTLMQEIALGTYNYTAFNEIMPMIYKRLTEKTAEEWRQVYKALQLLEFLVKHGSERVTEDARSHLSLIKILRNFHYIDEKGHDHGVHVSNKAKALIYLLSDLELLKQERRKARLYKERFIGVGSDDVKHRVENENCKRVQSVESLESVPRGNRDTSLSHSGSFEKKSSTSAFREYNEWEDGQDVSTSDLKSKDVLFLLKKSISNQKMTIEGSSLHNETLDSFEGKSDQKHSWKMSQQSVDMNHDVFDIFQSAELLGEDSEGKVESLDIKSLNQKTVDCSLTSKKQDISSHLLMEQTSDTCFLTPQMEGDDSIVPLVNINKCPEKQFQSSALEKTQSKFTETQSQDVFSTLWTTALKKDVGKLSTNELKS